MSNTGTINVKGHINTNGAGGPISLLGIVNLDGAAQQLGVAGTNVLTFKTLNAIGTDNKVMNVNVTVTDALSVNNGAAKYLDVADKVLTLGGTSTLTGGSTLNVPASSEVVFNSVWSQPDGFRSSVCRKAFLAKCVNEELKRKYFCCRQF